MSPTNCFSLNFRLLLAVCGVSIVLLPAAAVAAMSPNTLSPYFYVENGDADIDRLPLKSTRVNASIDGVIANVTIVQCYANEGQRPIHARYVFPASTRAAVHGVRMQIGDQVIVAQIQEREKAKRTFQAAKQTGQGAALLTAERPNVFTMKVANIMPGDQIRIELSYTELIVPTDGIYEFVYPAVVGPRYSTLPEAESGQHQQWLQTPYLRKERNDPAGFDIRVRLAAGMPLREVVCLSHRTEIASIDETRTTVALADSEHHAGDRDYVLRYRLSGEQIQTGLLRFAGETENFFLLMVQPPVRVAPEAIVPREYIFVVDVSGSMNGFPLDTAKSLLHDLIGSLRPTDRFNVVLFAGDAQSLAPCSLPANPAHLKRAIDMIEQRRGGGGTELYHALAGALKTPSVGGVTRSVVVVTDGYIALERPIFELIERHLDRTSFFAFGIGSSVNRHLIEGLARIGQGEPFVVSDPSAAPEAAEQFRRYIASPLLSDFHIRYAGWSPFDVEHRHQATLFADRPIIVCGKWRGEASGTIEITGTTARGAFSRTVHLAEMPSAQSCDALPYLWARTRLARLNDFNPSDADEELRTRIARLGVTYHLLTPYTAFVAVDETLRNPNAQGESVDHPLPLPGGVSELAVSGGRRVPEPGLVFMAALIGLAALSAWAGRKPGGGTPSSRRRSLRSDGGTRS